MKQVNKQGRKNEIGAIGESIAAKYLQNKGFSVIDINYLKKWGEIDIVALKTEVIHFIEVKTVSYETKQNLWDAVSQGTWRPEENVTEFKLKKLSRVIDSWLLEKKLTNEWQIDVVAVRIVPREKYATVKYLPNIII